MDNDKIIARGNIIYHESAGGYVFSLKNDGRIVVAILKKNNHEYCIPKGHLKEGEKPRFAALREIREELQLISYPILVRKIGINQYSFNLQNDQRIHRKKVHVYVYWLKEPEAIAPLTEEEFVEATWLTIEESSKRLTYGSSDLLKGYKYLKYFLYKKYSLFSTY